VTTGEQRLFESLRARGKAQLGADRSAGSRSSNRSRRPKREIDWIKQEPRIRDFWRNLAPFAAYQMSATDAAGGRAAP
jgi:hypothetical protein